MRSPCILFPEELALDYSFDGLNGGNAVNVAFNTGGDGSEEFVPEPLTMLGASVAVAFGAAFKRRRQQQ